MENKTPPPWELEWQARHVAAFWDWASQSEYMRSIYFSKNASDTIVRLTRKHISLRGTAVDYGCGPGDLAARLSALGMDVIGLDVSAESIAALCTRLAGDAHFRGGHVLPIPQSDTIANVADVVFMIEAIEHMDDQALSEALTNIRALLKPKGFLVVTTPNDENLGRAEVFCPNCGCCFHRMQHQRSWNKESLTRWMRNQGFEVIICRPYHTYDRRFPLNLVQTAWRRFRYPVPPNLIFIGVRN